MADVAFLCTSVGMRKEDLDQDEPLDAPGGNNEPEGHGGRTEPQGRAQPMERENEQKVQVQVDFTGAVTSKYRCLYKIQTQYDLGM